MRVESLPACKFCGGAPVVHGADLMNMEGPWNVACSECGESTDNWLYIKEAFRQWIYIHDGR